LTNEGLGWPLQPQTNPSIQLPKLLQTNTWVGRWNSSIYLTECGDGGGDLLKHEDRTIKGVRLQSQTISLSLKWQKTN